MQSMLALSLPVPFLACLTFERSPPRPAQDLQAEFARRPQVAADVCPGGCMKSRDAPATRPCGLNLAGHGPPSAFAVTMTQAQDFKCRLHLPVARDPLAGRNRPFSHDGFPLTHGALAGITIAMARHMQRHGAGQGSVVGVRSDDVTVTMASLLATGADRRALGLCERVGPAAPSGGRHAAARQRTPTRRSACRGRSLSMRTGRKCPQDAPTTPFSPGHARRGMAPWLISRTSGTTGTPKLVWLSPRIVTARNAPLNAEMFPRPGVCPVRPSSSVARRARTSRYLSALLHGGRILADIRARGLVAPPARHRLRLGPAQMRSLIGDRTLPRETAARSCWPEARRRTSWYVICWLRSTW